MAGPIFANDTWTPLLHTRKHWDVVVAWLFLTLSSSIVMFFVGRQVFKDIYPNLGFIAVGILMLSFAVLGIIKALGPFQVIAYADRIELKSILPKFNRAIFWEEISEWREEELKGKNETVQKIVFKYRNSNAKLSSAVYHGDYFALFMLFKEHCGNPAIWDKAKAPYSFAVGVSLVGVLITWAAFHSIRQGIEPISESSIAHISGPIAHNGVIHKSSKGHRGISISIATLPGWHFNLDPDAFNAMDRMAYVSGVHKGDTVQLGIDKNDYHKKLVGDMPLTLWDKVADYRTINVIAFNDKKQAYLTLEGYNRERSEIMFSGFALALGVIVLIGALGLWMHKLRQ